MWERNEFADTCGTSSVRKLGEDPNCGPGKGGKRPTFHPPKREFFWPESWSHLTFIYIHIYIEIFNSYKCLSHSLWIDVFQGDIQGPPSKILVGHISIFRVGQLHHPFPCAYWCFHQSLPAWRLVSILPVILPMATMGTNMAS